MPVLLKEMIDILSKDHAEKPRKDMPIGRNLPNKTEENPRIEGANIENKFKALCE